MPLLYAVPGGEGGVDARGAAPDRPQGAQHGFLPRRRGVLNSPHHSAKRSIS